MFLNLYFRAYMLYNNDCTSSLCATISTHQASGIVSCTLMSAHQVSGLILCTTMNTYQVSGFILCTAMSAHQVSGHILSTTMSTHQVSGFRGPNGSLIQFVILVNKFLCGIIICFVFSNTSV